ncbi:MAG: winged helix-turn-helix transcriptional regulator [Candidatus Woesearchaeota archaeon]
MSNITQNWVKILLPFTSGYSRRLTQSELAEISGIPQQTCSRHLNRLVEEGFVSYEVRGRNKLFFIDRGNPSANALFQALENCKALEFHHRVKDISVIISELLNYAESIILFGSYASYKYKKDSDIDILIMGGAEKEKIKKVKQRYNTAINEQYSSYREFRESLKSENPLAIEIMKNHILFGNISSIVKIFMEADYEH